MSLPRGGPWLNAQGQEAPQAGSSGRGVPAPGVFSVPETDHLAVPPPTCNTGVLHTKASIDYLAGTFPVGFPVQDVLPHFETLEASEWVDTERGANGYKRGLTRGHIRIFFEGNDNMGPFFELRGQGVDQFEAEQRFQSEDDWRAWQAEMIGLGVTFTRFDVAFDDQGQGADSVLHMEKVRRAIRQQKIVSRWEYADPSGKVSLSTGERLGDVVHFGSIMSEVSACFYDKAKEQLQKGAPLPPDYHWVRCEARFKKERAHAMVRRFVGEGLTAVAEVLHYYLDFKVASATDTNRSRWKTTPWWSRFLEGARKTTLFIEKAIRTIERTRDWLMHQVAPSFAVVIMAAEGGRGFVKTLFDKGKAKVEESPLYQKMLAAVAKQPDPDAELCMEHNPLVATVTAHTGGDSKFYARCKECGFTGPLVEEKKDAKRAFWGAAPPAIEGKLQGMREELAKAPARTCVGCGEELRWHSESKVEGICFHCFKQQEQEVASALLAL